jgi:hypothetical protein
MYEIDCILPIHRNCQVDLERAGAQALARQVRVGRIVFHQKNLNRFGHVVTPSLFGIVKWNVVPRPGTESNQMLPP